MGQREKNRKLKRQEQERAKMAPKPLDVVLTLLPAIFLFGIRTFAGPCVHEDGSEAACVMTSYVMTGLGVVALLLVFMRILGADLRTRRCFDLFLVVAGVLIAVLPSTALPLCAMDSMRCQAVMVPFARIMGLAIVVGALACEFTVDRDVPTGRKNRR